MLLPAAAVLVLLAALEVTVPAPDPDSFAHLLWARQLIHDGRVTITESGRFDDCSVYYPNTVPKPAQLLQALLGEIAGGGAAHAVIRVSLGAIAAAMAARAALRASGGVAWAGTAAGFLVGFHPVFVFLAISGSPIVPFLALLFAASTGASLASALFRLEGALYALGSAIRDRRPLLLLLLVPAAASWLLLNGHAAGDVLWSFREVRYVVQAMPYESPSPLGFWLFALGRAGLVCGPVLLAALLARPRAWPHAAGGALNLFLLSASLGAGSLVLPRYVDQVMLLALPWAVAAVSRARLPGFLPRWAVMAAGIAGAWVLWPSTMADMVVEHRIGAALDAVPPPAPGARTAANELLVPRMAASAGVDDPRRLYASIDRIIYEGCDPAGLGVARIVVVPVDRYLPRRTAAWLERGGPSCPVITLDVGDD